MRLLGTKTLTLHEFVEGQVPVYAILSHTWGKGEVLFRDLENDPSDKAGWVKIQSACRVASERGYDWIWIDTCCIDKASSSELSEAINSMYKWYQEASLCLAFLSDVAYCEPGTSECGAALTRGRWFTRGWTLQELLAPVSLDFYAQDWKLLGPRALFRSFIEKKTGIESMYLSGEKGLASASVAERMSWASQRTTTRTEDVAYCLLGIFNINMPLIYGEGAKAFQRLQEAILRENDDQSIFAWGTPHETNIATTSRGVDSRSLLAPSPKDFRHSGDIIPIFNVIPGARIRIEHSGIAIMTPLFIQTPSKWATGSCSQTLLAPLLCRHRTDVFNAIALFLSTSNRRTPDLDHLDEMTYHRLSYRLTTFPTTAWISGRLCSTFISFKSLPTSVDVREERYLLPSGGCAIRTLPKGFDLGVPYSPTWVDRDEGMQFSVYPITHRLARSYGLSSPIVIPLRGSSLQEDDWEGSLALVLQYQYRSAGTGFGDYIVFHNVPSRMVNRVVVVPPGFTLASVAETVQDESEGWTADYFVEDIHQVQGGNFD
ncbi:HET domain-containing protein [Colletotrichum filicis]|nr:HET domain-containing protein [Colletotrichum filicis]